MLSRLDGGQSVEVAQYLVKAGVEPLRRSGYNCCLSVSSAMLMKAQQIASNPSQGKRFQPVKHGSEPVMAARWLAEHPLCAGYYGRGRALHRRYTGLGVGYNARAPTATPHTGVVRPAVSVNRPERFLSEFIRPLQKALYRVLPLLSPLYTKERLNAAQEGL